MVSRTTKERQEARQQVSAIDKTIEELHRSMIQLERANGFRVGVSALVGERWSANRAIYSATVLMMFSRLSVSVMDELGTLGALIEKSATCPYEALLIRDACGEDGVLNRWIRLSNSFNVDTAILDFSDRAFAICMGRCPTRREFALSALKESTPTVQRGARRLPF